ncbi:MAG TPA: ATP-binding protein [Nitrospiraceae bacterium]|nr:ATP-binding protein [Nitrospiraceae bacterium]
MKSFRGLVRQSTLAQIAGLILIFSLLVYWGFETLLHQYVDGRLFALADTLGRLIQQRPDLVQLLDEDLLAQEEGAVRNEEERHQLREAAHSVRLLSSDGRLVWEGSDVLPQSPMEPAALERARGGEALYDTVRTADGSSIRRVSLPILSHGELRYILQAEASLLFAQKALTGLILLMAIVSVGIFAMAWISSGWLACKMLGPVKALSATAATISEPDARNRFALDAPYEEFQQLTRAFNAMMDRLQKSRESQGYFVDYAAHEMQTPLTVLQASLEVTLHKARTTAEYRDALINNLEQVERLVTLTRELLTLTRLAGDRTPIRRVSLELRPLLEELIEELAVLAEDHRIRLALHAEPAPPVLGDPQWLKQAIINLLDNAIRYTPPGGDVTVRLSATGGQVAVAVQDTGPGIGPQHVPHLFERFYRTDFARARDCGGTGLGLPIVKGIVDAHGGTITVDSHVGEGSIFTLILPADKEPSPSNR